MMRAMQISPPSVRPGESARLQPQADGVFRIVTFYKSISDAVRVVKNFDSINHTFADGRPVEAALWSFDLLRKPEMSADILAHVAEAEVLVVAAQGEHELPERIASWVVMSMAAHPVKTPVLVVLHDEELEADGMTAPLCESLRRIAGLTDAAFLCNSDLAQCTDDDSREIPMRSGRRKSVFEFAPRGTAETAR